MQEHVQPSVRVPAGDGIGSSPDPRVTSTPLSTQSVLLDCLAHQSAEQRAQIITGLSRSAGNRAVGRWLAGEVLARQPAPAKAPTRESVDLGWFDAVTNLQLAAAGRLAVGELEHDMEDLDGASAAWGRADEWLETVKAWLPYLDTKPSESIETTIASQARRLLKEYGEIRRAIQEEKLTSLREAYRRAERAAQAAADEAEALQPKLDDALRAAFRKGDSSAVKEAVSTVKGAISVGRNLRTLAFDISKELLKLKPPSGTQMYIRQPWDITKPIRVEIVSVSKYTDMLTKLGRGLSVISMALTIADRSQRATEIEQGMKDLNDVLGVSTDLGSAVGGLAPHMSLMTTLYIKPVLKVITKQIGRLVDDLSDVNRTSVAVTGDLMYPGAEPGGQEMFDFMRIVMKADRADQTPMITGKVEEFFYGHRDKLEAGAEEEVPTSGWWLWEGLDTTQARQWVFDHRRRVWAMFYGSMNPPARK
jgi:hypothetical protein